ncbi:uncharacterized protein LOC132202779 [Neocloeon triangulifer]|uniref:uncharacterized protein LOC132202779 n=1 Tax=Neocloeon triangulifer TaxID=2078957 RepID=UPI00286EFEFC|nr:uncharacterized protein LOC132202779 [Neocloeon triangulifer]XP_059485935.1 uncharacterized protein LOC132202779 [Neocloeon triangulifer]XP_059485936.1 uncharacterized protein LOC132202779 [Neocloeon triangulifer]
MTSSSSSDEEDNANLREALAPGFSIEAVKRNLMPKDNHEKIPDKASSKLTQKSGVKTMSQFRMPNVSCDNQKYLARELQKYLEKQIEEISDNPVREKRKKKKKHRSQEETGVKLLSTSNIALSLDQDEDEPEVFTTCNSSKTPRIGKRKLEDEGKESDEVVKVKDAAVSAEWVLKKRGDYGPLCRKPGEVIHVVNGLIQN